MIRFIAGEKGEGKTKRLLALANETAKTTDGNLVFIDHNRRYIHELHRDIRFVETTGYPLSNYREFVGFICGILSMNTDIKEIFVDGLTKVVRDIDDESLVKLVAKLEKLSATNELDFTISMSYNMDNVSDEIKKLII